MQDYTVASGIIVEERRVVFVQNQRKNGSLDWSTPGGVVDPGEGVLEALRREVIEETALDVAHWSPLLYTVDVDFIGRPLTLHAEVYAAQAFAGELTIDDPDNVVVDGRWVEPAEADRLLDTSPAWVAEPLRHALSTVIDLSAPHVGTSALASVNRLEPIRWRYDVVFDGPAGLRAELLEGPHG